jgi:hypothetical protein
MKEFLPTYLYVKTHNITGLKYFGKTTGDPSKYQGSGVYWLRHLKEHGYDVSTEILGHYTNREECISAAIEFSEKNDIVHALDEQHKKVWANQINENGTDGGDTKRKNYRPLSPETRAKMSASKKGSIPWNKGKTGVVKSKKRGQPLSDETKAKLRTANLGKKQSEETIKKRIASLTGRKRSEEFVQKMKGRKHSPESIEKMCIAQRGKIVSDETKAKLRTANLGKKQSDETKEKLRGKVVVINKAGEIKKISKEDFYSQQEDPVDREWVFHKSKEGLLRKQKVFSNQEAIDISKMRRG